MLWNFSSRNSWFWVFRAGSLQDDTRETCTLPSKKQCCSKDLATQWCMELANQKGRIYQPFKRGGEEKKENKTNQQKRVTPMSSCVSLNYALEWGLEKSRCSDFSYRMPNWEVWIFWRFKKAWSRKHHSIHQDSQMRVQWYLLPWIQSLSCILFSCLSWFRGLMTLEKPLDLFLYLGYF